MITLVILKDLVVLMTPLTLITISSESLAAIGFCVYWFEIRIDAQK
jgi:hypothetical protein